MRKFINDIKSWKTKIVWFDNGKITDTISHKSIVPKEIKLSKNPFKIKP